MSSEEAERDPHIKDQKANYTSHLPPLHGNVLGSIRRRGTDMTRKVKVIRIKIRYRKRRNSGILP